MDGKPVRGIFSGKPVWVNPVTEKLREKECLCFNCGNFKPDQPDNCHIAQAFFEICVKENVALAITRCPLWKPKSEGMKQ